MVNPAALLTIKKKWEEFSSRHPRFVAFASTLQQSGVPEGSVIDISVTLPGGEKYQSNLKLTAEDIEMIKSLGAMK